MPGLVLSMLTDVSIVASSSHALATVMETVSGTSGTIIQRMRYFCDPEAQLL